MRHMSLRYASRWTLRNVLPGTINTARTLSGRIIAPAILFTMAASAHAGETCAPHWDNAVGQPGMDLFVTALAEFDDASAPGGGPALYAGGLFTTAGGTPANRIAKWNGQAWAALGSGVSGGPQQEVHVLTVFDDGSGPALYVGGTFTTAGDVTVNNIAKWDGTEWSALGSGTNASVRALAVFDDDPGSGNGPSLYAAGFFTAAGDEPANRVAKWDGRTWTPLGDGLGGGAAVCLAAFDDAPGGGGPALFVGGEFVTAGNVPANRIAKWNGAEWSALGSGMGGGLAMPPAVYALTAFDDHGGPTLYAGGTFTTAGGVLANRIAKWNGQSWSSVGGGMGGDYSSVYALAVFDESANDGDGPALIAGGNFTTVGGVAANRIAKWDGMEWSALGSGMNTMIWALAVIDIAPAPGGSDPPVLYAGGVFTQAGGLPSSRIAQWRTCPEKEECLPCDFNCDGVVGVPDLLYLLANWGPCPGCDTIPCGGCGACPADLTGDCVVGVPDLLVLLAKWG